MNESRLFEPRSNKKKNPSTELWITGLMYFEENRIRSKKFRVSRISGEDAFYLYDTLGFPIDLVKLLRKNRA